MNFRKLIIGKKKVILQIFDNNDANLYIASTMQYLYMALKWPHLIHITRLCSS